MGAEDPADDLSLPRLAGHAVSRVPAYRALKGYICPNCSNGIAVGEGHVVAWPEGSMGDRRHWHTHCWRLAARRGRVT